MTPARCAWETADGSAAKTTYGRTRQVAGHAAFARLYEHAWDDLVRRTVDATAGATVAPTPTIRADLEAMLARPAPREDPR